MTPLYLVGTTGFEPVTLPIVNRDALNPKLSDPSIFSLGGNYWIRTSDPPDCKSGCSEPEVIRSSNRFSWWELLDSNQ
jgi:hypothetical protein